jgi:putative ABC transport system permease protein
MRALDRKLTRDLWRMRGQVLTISLVLASGVAALLALMGTYRSLSTSRDAYYDRYAFPDAFAHLERAPDPIAERLRQIPGVTALEPRLVERASLLLPDLARPASGRAISLPEAHGDPRFPLRRLALRAGRLPDPGHPEEALLLASFAESHAITPGSRLDVVVAGKRLRLAITGTALSPEWVFPAEAGVVDYRTFGVVWLSRDALAAACGKQSAFDDVTFHLAPNAQTTAVLGDIDRVLAPWGGLGAIARDQQISDKLLRGELEQLEVLATEIPIVFLLVAAFLLNVALNRIVHLQREQLAVLRALGYSRLQLARHVLGFTSVVVLLGGSIGLALGVILGGELIDLYTQFFHFPVLAFTLDTDLIATGLVTTALAALSGALTAAWRAARLAPAEAMRPPSPARYRKGLLSRLVSGLGLSRFIGPMGRMILRELERRPGAMLVSVSGIAFAAALVVLGRFGLDSFTTMLDLTFARAMRDDVTLVLARPAPHGELNTLRHLPGVLAVEPMHMVPVRLVNGSRRYDTSLTGLREDARLRRIIDGASRPRSAPIEGLMLTDLLAERLNLDIGDTLRVERRDADHRVMDLPVVARVDELVGMNAYLDLDALAEALGEAPMFTAAALQIDASARDALMHAITTLPNVVMVTERRAIREAIDAQTGDTMSVWTLIVVIFGIVIAVGVIYNNARIALSERGRDLATLRVLGYSRAEVAVILIGQLAVHTAIAIPLGFIFGFGLATLLMSSMDPEQFRVVTIVNPDTYAFASLVVLGSSLATALVVRRRLDAIDLVGALKARD